MSDKKVGCINGDCLNGEGINLDPIGIKYIGHFKDGEYHGKGILTAPDGNIYEGQFKNGKRHGQGKHISPDRGKYIGQWKDDKAHGFGIYISPEGNGYVGQFKEDKFIGQEVQVSYSLEELIVDDYEKLKGKFYKNDFIDEWIMIYPDGTKYVWIDDEFNKNDENNLEKYVNNSEKDLSVKKAIKYRARDGHHVKTRADLVIDNWLYKSNIMHEYNVQIEGSVHSSFYLPNDKIYIEYWGDLKDIKNLHRKNKKIEIYIKYRFNLLELSNDDIKNLDEILPKKILAFGIQV